jgi:hypothetical protein
MTAHQDSEYDRGWLPGRAAVERFEHTNLDWDAVVKLAAITHEAYRRAYRFVIVSQQEQPGARAAPRVYLVRRDRAR